MFKQLLIALVVLVLGLAVCVFFVPGSAEALGRIGITLPTGTSGDAQTAAPGQGGPQAGGQRPGNGGFGGGGRGSNRTMVVVTAPVASARINDTLNAIGVGAAFRSVSVIAGSGGTLVDFSVAPGDKVKAGDVIAHLDAQTETIALDRARLSVTDAESAFSRATELAKSNAVTTVQFNTAQSALENARLELKSAELALARRTIATPIAGAVGLFQVTQGNYVGAQAVVTTIEDNSDIRVSFWVPERYASAIATGMDVTAEAVALPGRVFAGKVSAVDNRVDTTSRTLAVEASIPNADGAIRAGMSFAVSMRFPGQDFASVDPLSIQWSGEGAYVWKYQDGKVEKAMVRIIQRNSDGVLVDGDVEAGDAVVVQGVQQLTAGASVRLLDAPAEGNGQRREGGQGNGGNAGNGQGGNGGQGGNRPAPAPSN